MVTVVQEYQAILVEVVTPATAVQRVVLQLQGFPVIVAFPVIPVYQVIAVQVGIAGPEFLVTVV